MFTLDLSFSFAAQRELPDESRRRLHLQLYAPFSFIITVSMKEKLDSSLALKHA